MVLTKHVMYILLRVVVLEDWPVDMGVAILKVAKNIIDQTKYEMRIKSETNCRTLSKENKFKLQKNYTISQKVKKLLKKFIRIRTKGL